MTGTNIINWIKQNCEYYSDVEYGKNGFIFHSRDASDKRRGIYFFINNNDIQKVGKVEQQEGIRARTGQYQRSLSRIKNKTNDASDLLWDSTMNTHLKNKTLEFWFYPIETEIRNYNGIEVQIDGIRACEFELSTWARNEGHSMHLAGKGN